MFDFAPGTIQGTAVEYRGVEYTLNFDQQNKLLEALFHAKEEKSSSDVRYVIYFFDRPPLFIEGQNIDFDLEKVLDDYVKRSAH